MLNVRLSSKFSTLICAAALMLHHLERSPSGEINSCRTLSLNRYAFCIDTICCQLWDKQAPRERRLSAQNRVYIRNKCETSIKLKVCNPVVMMRVNAEYLKHKQQIILLRLWYCIKFISAFTNAVHPVFFFTASFSMDF